MIIIIKNKTKQNNQGGCLALTTSPKYWLYPVTFYFIIFLFSNLFSYDWNVFWAFLAKFLSCLWPDILANIYRLIILVINHMYIEPTASSFSLSISFWISASTCLCCSWIDGICKNNWSTYNIYTFAVVLPKCPINLR